MDEAFWESFEPIFTEWSRGQLKMGIGLDKIKSKIEASGYRCIENGHGTHFDQLSGQILWDEIYEALLESGSVIYCRTNLEDGEFVWIQEIENPNELSFEVQITKYYDGEYDDTETQIQAFDSSNATQFNMMFEMVGLEMREEMKDVDGEQTYVKEIMFSQYYGSMQKMWFTNAIFIPQPFNMSWPQWLMKAIRKRLTALRS